MKNIQKKLLHLFLMLIVPVSLFSQTTIISENIQSWTNRGSYGSYTQNITVEGSSGTVTMTRCMVANAAAATGTCTAGRVQMEASNGIIELPQVSSVSVAEFHIAAGAAGRSVKLQQYNGSSWVDVTTFTGIGTTGATFTYTLNNTSATRLRLASPSAAVYVHDIIIKNYVPVSPLLSVTSPLAFGSQCTGSTYGPNTFTITGSNLTTANVTVGALSGFTYSTSSGGTYTSSLSLTQPGGTYSQTIYVKFSPTLVQSYNGSISVGGGGATSVNSTASGSGINSAATIGNPSSSSVSYTTAIAGGEVLSLGCSNITERGIYYSTTDGFADGTGSKVSSTGTFGTGVFTENLSGLTSGTTYYYKAFATNSGGTVYTSQASFTCLKSAPTTQATLITFSSTGSSATTVGWANGNGDKRVVIINTTNSFTNPIDGSDPSANTVYGGSGEQVVYNSSGSSVTVTGLSASTNYWFRVYEYNNSGTNTKYNTNTSTDNPNSKTTLPEACHLENFSNIGTSTSYGNRSWTGTGGTWQATDAREDQTINGKAITIRSGTLTSPQFTDGVGSITLTAKFPYTESSGDLTIKVNGTTVGYLFYAEMNGTTPVTKTLYDINISGNVIITAVSTGARYTIDDLQWTCRSGPEINLTGNGNNINSGSSSPNLTDHTDFGSAEVAGGTVIRTFTIENNGNLALNLTGSSPYIVVSGTNASDFTVTSVPSTPISSMNSTTFQITFDPSSTGVRTASISIANDDDDENPYTFAIQGSGTNSNQSDIAEDNTTYSSNIDYTLYQVATITNTSQSVTVFRFTIRDGGASASDADSYGTELNAITFNVTNISNIRTAALFNGNTMGNNTPDINTGNGTITFSGLSGSNFTAGDNSTRTLTLRITFNSTVTDNQQMQFTISTASASNSGSIFASANAGGAISSTTGDRNRIEVTADRLAFVQQPSTSPLNTGMVPDVTVQSVDVFGNRDLDYISTINITSTGTLTGSPVGSAATSGLATFTGLIHTTTGTGLTLEASASGLITIISNPFNINTIVYLTGDYRSTGSGTWANGGASTIWERYNTPSPGWNTGVNAPSWNTTNNIYVQFGHTITTAGSFGSSVNIRIFDGGTFNCNHSSTATNIYIYTGGTLNVNAALSIASGGNLEVLDGGNLKINFAYGTPATSLWNGTEIFHPESNLFLIDWDGAGDNLLADNTSVSTNTYNGYSAAFGNIICDFGSNLGSSDDMIFIAGGVSINLAHGDLIFRTNSTAGADMRLSTIGTVTSGIGGDFIIENTYTGTQNINLKTSGTLNFTIGGNLELNAATLRVQAGSGNTTLSVNGNLIITPSAVLDFNSTVASGPLSIINLKGDISVASSGLLQNTNSSSLGQLNFTGTGDGLADATTQTIDIASTSTNENRYIAFGVNSGAYVKLANRNFELGTNSGITVKSGGIFDFGFNGTTPLVIGISGSASGTYFTSENGSTLKITSADGINTSGSSGNVMVVASNRTFGQSATFCYIGKSPAQITGTGITTGTTGKVVIVELDANTTTLSLTNGTGISSATTVDPLGGKLEIRKGTLISTIASPITSDGRLIMTDGKYMIEELTTVPQLSGSYNLTGGIIELYGSAGTQTLRGGRDYYSITFSGGGTKYISSALSNIGDNSLTGIGEVLISDNNTILDVTNSEFSGNANLTMTGNSLFRMSKLNTTLPQLSGTYTLSGGTVELYGSGSTQTHSLKGGITYNNVELNAQAANTSFDEANIVVNQGFSILGTMNVNSPACLKIGSSYTISGSGNFVVNAGSALKYGSIDGINNSGTNSGNIQTTSRTFSNLASYGFVGSLNQNSGNGLPSSMINMFVDKTNTASVVVLVSPVIISGDLVMNSGNLNTGANTLSLGTSVGQKGNLQYTSGYLIGKMLRWFNGTNSGNTSGLFPLGIDDSGLKNRHVLVEYNLAATSGGSLTAEWVPNAMGTSGISIPAASTGGFSYDVTSTADQGYWRIDNQAGTLTNGAYTIACTGEGINEINDLAQLTLLKREGAGNWTCPGNHLAPSGSTSVPTVSRSGVSDWSNFGFGGGDMNPLPVEIIRFDVECQNESIIVHWSTSSEINNDYFVVERSLDFINWNSSGIVDGNGNSNHILNYYFEDVMPVYKAYYRLKQVDFDGEFKYSPIVVNTCYLSNTTEVIVYPNPCNDILNIAISNWPAKNIKFEISNFLGQIIYNGILENNDAYNTQNINTSVLEEGLYNIRLFDSENSLARKFIKQ